LASTEPPRPNTQHPRPRAKRACGMRADYVLKRIGFFCLIVWLAGTLNFFIPRLSGQNPIRQRLIEQAVVGGYAQSGMNEMVAAYESRFGLDQPLGVQYVRYMTDLL